MFTRDNDAHSDKKKPQHYPESHFLHIPISFDEPGFKKQGMTRSTQHVVKHTTKLALSKVLGTASPTPFHVQSGDGCVLGALMLS